ncbi:MAG: hypothetical protein MJD61_06360 [Proteobacteria bacterium]|nr:hypothetical protein [Pseudomonadota bacterium]
MTPKKDSEHGQTKMMRAIVFRQYGAPREVMKLVDDQAVPKPKPNEVLVKVEGSSVNAADKHMVLGNYLIEKIHTGVNRDARSACLSHSTRSPKLGSPATQHREPAIALDLCGRLFFAGTTTDSAIVIAGRLSADGTVATRTDRAGLGLASIRDMAVNLDGSLLLLGIGGNNGTETLVRFGP